MTGKKVTKTMVLILLAGIIIGVIAATPPAPKTPSTPQERQDQAVSSRDVTGLQEFATITNMNWQYNQQTEWKTAARETQDGRVSPLYDPENYVFSIAVGEGVDAVVLTTRLSDVRLVYRAADKIAVRAKGTDTECYIELNTPPEEYESALTDEFYTGLDPFQIVFIRQYLSDRYLELP